MATRTPQSIPLKGHHSTEDQRLDRVPLYDEASRNYQVRTLLDAGRASRPRRRSAYPAHPTLDQGPDGACVGFSIATAMNASPRRIKPELEHADAFDAYHVAQHRDPWDGCHFGANCPITRGPQYEGTATLSGLQVARERGWIASYYWVGAGSGRMEDDAWESAREYGILLGIPWYRSMFRTTPGGLLEVDRGSGLAGYHAIYAVTSRYAAIKGHGSQKREHYVVQNTWGDWGTKWYGMPGHAFVLAESVHNDLLPRSVYGEAAVCIEP